MCVVNERVIDGKTYVPDEECKQWFEKANKVVESLHEEIRALKRENAEMAKQLSRSIELPDCRPISVAKALIDMDRLFYKDGTEYEGFTRKQLRQIAEHLLVYCNEGARNRK